MVHKAEHKPFDSVHKQTTTKAIELTTRILKMAFEFWQVMTSNNLKPSTLMRYHHLNITICTGSSLSRRSTCQCSSSTACSGAIIKKEQLCICQTSYKIVQKSKDQDKSKRTSCLQPYSFGL